MAQRIARAGPSNVAKKPSPAVSDLEAVPAAEAVSDDRVMLLEQTLVPVVPHLGLFLRRSHDVREQDGRQHGVELGRVRLDADELPDHIQHGGLLVDPQLIRAGEEPDLGLTQERRQVLERLAVVLASQEEHGRSDRRHGASNICLVVDPVHLDGHIRGGRLPAEPAPRDVLRLRLRPRPHRIPVRVGAPEIDGRGRGSRDEVLARTEWIVRRPGRPRRRVPPDEGVDALGERGREQDVGRATFECAAEDRPLGADGIQDDGQIRDAGLEVGRVDVATRSSRSATVMQDQTRERREPAEPLRGGSVLPDRVDVPQPIELPDDVDRAIAHRLIRDVDAVESLRVAGLRALHVRILAPAKPRRKWVPPRRSYRRVHACLGTRALL